MFDPDYIQPYTQIGPEVVDSPYHQQLALEVIERLQLSLEFPFDGL